MPVATRSRGVLPSGSIVVVHNLRNRLLFPEHGLHDIPLMVSVSDIAQRPYLKRSIRDHGIKAHLGITSPVFVDSGGFSLAESSNCVSLDELIALYKVIDADVLAALDLPPRLNDRRSARVAKWSRTLRYLDRLLLALGDRRIMPVIHGCDLSEIARACEDVRHRVARPRVVALGGMVPFLRGASSREGTDRSGSRQRPGTDFVADALTLCRSEFSHSRIHVFGVGSPTTAIALLALGADSVDSLAWRRAAGFGTIFIAGCAERIVSLHARQRFSRPVLSGADKRILVECNCPVCSKHTKIERRIQALADSYVARSVHNVWTLIAEQDALRAARRAGTLNGFVASRINGRHRFARAIRAHLGADALAQS